MLSDIVKKATEIVQAKGYQLQKTQPTYQGHFYAVFAGLNKVLKLDADVHDNFYQVRALVQTLGSDTKWVKKLSANRPDVMLQQLEKLNDLPDAMTPNKDIQLDTEKLKRLTDLEGWK